MRPFIALLIFVLILLIPKLARAQDVQCPGCVIGLFDDPGLSRNFGSWDASTEPVKSVWVGISYDPGHPSRHMTGVEFSIDGIGSSCPTVSGCFNFEGLVEPAVTIGLTVASPDDKQDGVGGVNIAWGHCLVDDRVFVRLDLSSVGPVPNDVVLRVTRKFPPTSPTLPHPWFSTCDDFVFAPVTVSGGCYVINPTAGPGGRVEDCVLAESTPVAPPTWSLVKTLYR